MLSSAAVKISEKSDFLVAGSRRHMELVPSGIKDPLWLLAGARISHLRTECALPATRLGELSGLGPAAVALVEDGKRCPKIDTIELISCALDVSPSWIAFGHEGYEPFQQRRPREPVPLDPPIPHAEARPATERYKSVGERCRKLRQLRGLSLRAAATAAGISHESLNLVEKGGTIPLVATCERLAVAFDVAPAWLTYGEGQIPEGIADEAEAAAGSVAKSSA